MESKRISVSELAAMVKRGFDEVQGDLRDLRQEVSDIRGETNHRVNRVEYEQGSRLDRLDDDMRRIKARLGVQ
jgi:hypothetical protein